MEVSTIVRKPAVISSIVGVIAFGGGLALGYILGKRDGTVTIVPEDRDYDPNAEDVEAPQDPQLELVFVETEEDVPDEYDKMEEARRNHPSNVERPAPELVRIVTEYEGVTNVFTTIRGDDWDYEIEAQLRKAGEPYVLHRDEFFAEELGYDQISVTYYDADDILADDGDHPVPNYHRILGEMKFGHGSGDPNIVYIRNDERCTEYEVMFDEGSYQQTVLGIEAENKAKKREVQHSVLKFRDK